MNEPQRTRAGRVTVFNPSPVLEISIGAQTTGDTVRLAAAGQGVWAARAALALDADVTLCCLVGGDIGRVVSALLDGLGAETRLLPAQARSGCFLVDRRSGGRDDVVVSTWADAPTPAEVDALVATTRAAARTSDVVVVGNPLPGDALPLSVYRSVVADACAAGAQVVVDLSSPRLDAALAAHPDIVKLNDWELAEFVVGPVDSLEARGSAMTRLLDAGAGSVVVSRGGLDLFAVDPAGEMWGVTPPPTTGITSAGCGDAMTGAMAAALAQGQSWQTTLAWGVAAGAAVHHLGVLDTDSGPVIRDLVAQVRLVGLAPQQ